ncbi:MAG: HEAT repeat domain-containing protein, partial [Clostridiales bacterium]|nr:HEAT repeat domain-containing protein [Clostridiales bacterium]
DAAVRHAAIKGLGVAGGEEAFNNLTALLRDPNPETRKAAAGALELLKDPKSVAFIDARLRVETDEGVKAALRKAQSAVNTGN